MPGRTRTGAPARSARASAASAAPRARDRVLAPERVVVDELERSPLGDDHGLQLLDAQRRAAGIDDRHAVGRDARRVARDLLAA